MHNIRGKHGHNLGMEERTTGARLSTQRAKIYTDEAAQRVQPVVLPKLFPIHPLYISPVKRVLSPLIEHYLYPVSTGPIINPIKEI